MVNAVGFHIQQPYIVGNVLNVPVSYNGSDTDAIQSEIIEPSIIEKEIYLVDAVLNITHQGIATTQRCKKTLKIKLNEDQSQTIKNVSLLYVNFAYPQASYLCRRDNIQQEKRCVII